MADENNIDFDLIGVQDESKAVADGNQQFDSDNPWQLPDLPQPQSSQDAEIKEFTTGCLQPANGANQWQPVQQVLPVETSSPLSVGGESSEQRLDPVVFVNNLGLVVTETNMSQGLEVGKCL